MRQKLNSDLQRIQTWITHSKIRFNVQKSSVMWFCPKKASGSACPPVLVSGNPPQELETQKYLGIMFDKELKWGAQVSNVCKKISYYLYMLSVNRKSPTFEVLEMLTDHESLILSRIDYALPVWGPPLNKSQVAHLQHLQNRVIRITVCLRKYDHVYLHRCQLNWLPISHQIMFKSSCAMYRHYHHDKQPCLLLNPPIVFEAQCSYNTQCKDCFANPPSYRLSTTKKIFPFLCYNMVEFSSKIYSN